VRRGFSSSDAADLVRAEHDVQARLSDVGIDDQIDFVAMAAVANVFRVASAARGRLERTVLAPAGLSFTAFTVLWVLWVWGELEPRVLATEAGITKGTLTGVVSTLERRDLVERRPHPVDRRQVLVACTPDGHALMGSLFTRFNVEEARLSSGLDDGEARHLAHLLRRVLRTIETLDVACSNGGSTHGDG
jgi:DNA-binding MarR family transcriptional regulator